jgi:hypothetical protein
VFLQEVNINQDDNEVEEQVGAQAQAGAEVQGRLEVQAGDIERAETFEVTQSAIVSLLHISISKF